MNFYLTLGAPFVPWEADFHKIKGREILSRSCNDLNTLDNHLGLTESSSTSTELCNASVGIKIF
jgi:hypothetical protein